MTTDVNDRRMVPGPSDEDLDDFLSDPQFPSLDADDLTETSFEWTVVKLAIRAALARWGAQTEYDAHEAKNARGLSDVIQEHMTPDLFPITDTSTLGQDAMLVRDLLAAVRSSRRKNEEEHAR